MMWMFLAILITFLITRTVTRLIRSGGGASIGLGNVRIVGNHIHHQVFGILIIIGTGIVLVSVTPQGAGLDAAAAIFGVGVALTVDEFALWLHLEDVYWSDEGRLSVEMVSLAMAWPMPAQNRNSVTMQVRCVVQNGSTVNCCLGAQKPNQAAASRPGNPASSMPAS
jgi:hypothetical protein